MYIVNKLRNIPQVRNHINRLFKIIHQTNPYKKSPPAKTDGDFISMD